MSNARATLYIKVMVSCPRCYAAMNLASSTEFPSLNDEGEVIGQLFLPRQTDWREKFEVQDVECPECGKEFNVEGIDW